jgi:hypothetical protein
MKDRKCSKFYPKKFVARTSFDPTGYPVYRRRDSGVTVLKKDALLDNRSVVPYNPKLIMKYQAHVNIEYCNKSNSIKYLFKYINKIELLLPYRRVTMNVSMKYSSIMITDSYLLRSQYGEYLLLIFTIGGLLLFS